MTGVQTCALPIWEYSIMGVWEVIKNLSRIFALLKKLTNFMAEEKPDLLVLIDYPDFNWRLAAKARKMGIPVFSYIPPSAWAWRKGRAKKCAALANELAAIFPFELPVYQAAGANISFQGNPLIDMVKSTMTVSEAREYFQVPADGEPVLILPTRNELSFRNANHYISAIFFCLTNTDTKCRTAIIWEIKLYNVR